ncbi:copper transporter [Nakamurella leprariae]|uniref:Copper transporter n=1 Tax=Nakamurella leprariae TaxID=2803911 RepID=A0A938YKT4_9ACTN|nr:copper transporter [Nakamurella leprariae]MBM9469610.1 copper transporter [Nakamurella leprariae]
MRYHIVSVAAIFLALALGVVLGATKINSPLLSGLQGDNTSLSSQVSDLAETNAQLTERVADDQQFAGAIGPLAVRGTLPDATVVLLTTADADPADRDAVTSLLTRAGATVTGQLQLTTDLADPNRAAELRSLVTSSLPAGVTLPESPDAGTTVGALLGALLVAREDGSTAASPEAATATLAALTSAGFVTPTGTPAAGRGVVVLTGAAATGGSEADRAAVIADLAAAMEPGSSGVVLAGRTGSQTPTGSVGVVRSDTAATATVTTVDNVDTDTGRLATVLGLVEQFGGGSGRYGIGDNAQAQVPTLAVPN